MLRVNETIRIPETELTEEFVTGSGPGGQHVNRAATTVQLRFDAARSPSLDDRVREQLRHLAGSRMTTDGVLVIRAGNRRSLRQNRDDARDRLARLIREAALPRRRRIATRPTRASYEQRLESKKRRADTKRLRRPPT
jgi:ribosome-associated protein